MVFSASESEHHNLEGSPPVQAGDEVSVSIDKYANFI